MKTRDPFPIRSFFGVVLVAALPFSTASSAFASQVLFSDSLDSTPSPLWGNQTGNWTISDGGYRALNSFAVDITSLPYVLTNFSVDVDIKKIADGGIWLRSDATGKNGVLLVTGGSGWGWGPHNPTDQGRNLYWHIVRNGDTGPGLGIVMGLFTPEVSSAHFHIEVHGDVYEAYLNGSKTPVTRLINSEFSSGRVGLYDYSIQSFNNFVLTADASETQPATIPPATPVPVASASTISPSVVIPTVRTNQEAVARPLSTVVLSNVPAPFVSISTAVEISWPSQPGATYQVQWASSLGDNPAWTNLGASFEATDTNTSVFDSVSQGSSKFYRVQILQ